MKLVYRSPSAGWLGDFFDAPWPDWVRALRGKSGVYVIRKPGGGPVLYVGESHTGRLYDTLTRHFQSWSGKTAGVTYGRGSVEIAVNVCAASKAVDEQNRMICRLEPRDNTVSPLCELNENPF